MFFLGFSHVGKGVGGWKGMFTLGVISPSYNSVHAPHSAHSIAVGSAKTLLFLPEPWSPPVQLGLLFGPKHFRIRSHYPHSGGQVPRIFS